MSEGGEDHYQALARTHKLSDASVYFFLAHSEVFKLLIYQGHGSLLQYRYDGPTEQDHVLESSPPTYGTLEELRFIDSDRPEQHPSDITFLPEVDGLDAGYLFVTEEYDNRRVTVYLWEPGQDLAVQGQIFAGFPTGGPQFLFLDRVDSDYYLGIASEHWGWGQLFRVPAEQLFAKCAKGSMNVDAFRLVPFIRTGASINSSRPGSPTRCSSRSAVPSALGRRGSAGCRSASCFGSCCRERR
jgi:hypothetical protein